MCEIRRRGLAGESPGRRRGNKRARTPIHFVPDQLHEISLGHWAVAATPSLNLQGDAMEKGLFGVKVLHG